jgi:hypothetical protein
VFGVKIVKHAKPRKLIKFDVVAPYLRLPSDCPCIAIRKKTAKKGSKFR